MRAHRARPLFQDIVRSMTLTFRYPPVCLWHQFSSLLDRAMDSGVAEWENCRLDVKAAGGTESGSNMERNINCFWAVHISCWAISWPWSGEVEQRIIKFYHPSSSSFMLVPVLTSQFTNVKRGKWCKWEVRRGCRTHRKPLNVKYNQGAQIRGSVSELVHPKIMSGAAFSPSTSPISPLFISHYSFMST